MSGQRGAGSGKRTLTFTEDDLDSNRVSHSVLKFVGKIPAAMEAGDAVRCLSMAAAEYLGTLSDGLEGVSTLRSYVSNGRGTLPYAVTSCFVVPPDLRDALLGRRDARFWVELPAPWGGHALVEFGADELQEVHLVGLPVGLRLNCIWDKLLQAGINVQDMEPLTDPATQLPRADAARAFLPASCRVDMLDLQGPDGPLAAVQVHRISRLPPAPGEQPGAGSYAAAVAGGARPPPRPPAAASVAAAVAAAVAAPASAAPAAAPASAAVAAATATFAAPAAAAPASPRATRGQQAWRPQQQQPAPRRPPSHARQRSSQRGRPPAAAAPGSRRGSPGVSPKRQCIGDAAAPSLASPNPFGQLGDVTDMDADAAAMAAQLTAAEVVPDGSTGTGGS